LSPLEDPVNDEIIKPVLEGVEPVIRIGEPQQLISSIDNIGKKRQASEQDEKENNEAGNSQIALEGRLDYMSHCNLLL
jgi:hypothetical protein